MKKAIKITALILAVAMTAISLCSCQYLDEMRAHQAFYTNSLKNQIDFNGKLYDEYRYSGAGNRALVFDESVSGTSGYTVTQRDVPVLLSQKKGDWFYLSEDASVIRMYSDSNDYYFRTDVYDDNVNKLTNAKLDRYFFSYLIYPENYNEPYAEASNQTVLLDDELTAVINRALKTPYDQRVSNNDADYEDYYESYNEIFLTRCDKDLQVQDDSGDWIQLVIDDDKYFVRDERTDDDKCYCPITDDKEKAAVKALFDQYKEATKYFKEYFAW